MAEPSKKKDSPEPEQAAAESPPDPLKTAVPQFHGRIDGLRELLEIISPHVAALDISEGGGFERLIDEGGFSDSGIAVMKEIFGGRSDLDSDPADGDERQEQRLTPEQSLAFGEVVTSERAAFQGFLRRMVRGAMAPREDLLNSSLLTLAVATFENLLALLVTEHLRRFPGMLESEEKAFSLSDLQDLGSIEDARTILIERRVDSFMRKGLDDWSRWTEQTLGASFSDLCIDLDAVREIFQRRHLIVHAGGIVNRMYLERAPLEGDPPQLGTQLSVSGEYVTRALDEFEVLGDLLLFTAWTKWTDGDDRQVAHGEFEERILELMASHRWEIVRRLCGRGSELRLPASGELVFLVNQWIAVRRLGEFDGDHRKAVEGWDTSALALPFVLAKAILLDEDERAFELLELALMSEEIDLRAAETWPLFEELRKDPRFLKILAAAKKKKSATKTKSRKRSTAKKTKSKSSSKRNSVPAAGRRKTKPPASRRAKTKKS